MAELSIMQIGLNKYYIVYDISGSRVDTTVGASEALALINRAQQQGTTVKTVGRSSGYSASAFKSYLQSEVDRASTQTEQAAQRRADTASAAEFLGAAPRAAAPSSLPLDPALRSYLDSRDTTTPDVPAPTIPEPSGFREPKLSDSTYDLIDTTTGKVIGRNVAQFNSDYQDYLDFTSGIGGAGGAGGPTGPTAAELAIQRSQIDAQNLSTFISGTIAELEIEVDAKRLSTEQALGEFNKRLDAFAEAGSQFQGIQPYTIPIGAEYVPGFQPGGIGEQLGIEPRRAEVIQFDPFAMANQIVADSPDLTEIGVPDTSPLDEANRIARQFLGV